MFPRSSDEDRLLGLDGGNVYSYQLNRTIRIFDLENCLLTFIINSMNCYDVTTDVN